MKKRSKKYEELLKKFDKKALYSAEDAVKLAKELTTTKFDSSVELAIRLNLDTKKVDQQIRGAFVLPNGTGKTKRILVLAKSEKAKDAENAGADYVGDINLIEKIEKSNWLDFDVIIATPDMMPLLGKLGKILGPKGLMPNPKTGTVTNDIAKAVADVKKGMIEYKTDSFGIVHAIIGKVSFSEESLLENLFSFVQLIKKIKPTAAKGVYIKSIVISTTMGPGIKIDENSFDK